MAMVSTTRLAPTEKFAPWFATTSATPSASARFTARWTMASTSPPMAFILVWNSRQKTPSPRSTTDAPEFRSTSAPPFLRSRRSTLPSGRTMSRQASVAGSRVRRRLPSST